MHYKEVKSILSTHNGMNVYRGCSHGCIYCDSRSACYGMDHLFEDLEVKINAPMLLEKALISKKEKCMIGTGSMGDPYCHIEEKENITRKCLEIIYKYGFGVTIITKSTRLLRDLDLLKKINEKSKVVIQVTLTTYDDELTKIIEPNVSSTKERFEMLKILRDNNIPTVVWLCPFLPFINDTKENLMGLLNYCKEAKVYGIICFGIGLTLREGNREYFYQCLDKYFPGLKEKYINTYHERYEISSNNNNTLMYLFKDFCSKNNIVCDNSSIFQYLGTFSDDKEQLSLF